ncbi:hypothetical protein LUD23_30160, partial [Klebsiella pneumoniae]|nr:hypothetical protein [Klebsiella pneumoniae]
IQSHTFICEYVTIGQRCFIGHGVMFANDLFREGKPNADRASWVIEGAYEVLGIFDKITEGVDVMKSITLTKEEQRLFGQAALT